ncbi:MAG: 1,2-phenylacetyl-CoA epoxidase subunit PaaC [Bacteroidota bacterium]|nr:1,2-phenylacetyl-CoA epoxidase subunit PaaC [Bacteroidota bacterium]MDP4214956.1 1,2-phenylacetyl-CoA epoxidase subunit PaaC [Bacteroidota bacterium]MDP4244635.1 1,2-phenylacetyl-CoA epoxidase subunit PaaC [Bacteroidota bacterium]MDP4254630.1 1,2-phenylacetyl-CoA epoxidase subunit PaaC [Bacteroidota bacterium]MDP4258669.1 1,2-phenylacetyl-CoA epoxidase subunit PaaC [Bacteroidota bacterium]
MQTRQALIDYTLHLADNALILGHRNSEWTGHGPILEQDIALSNIALDLIGQARLFYQYAALLINKTPAADPTSPLNHGTAVTEDSLAYLRDAWDFKNCLLCEQTNGDWGKTVLRQFYFSAYQFYLYGEMQKGKDATLAAIAEKALKEVTYHLRWSSEWVIRLGDGTAESHARMEKAVGELSRLTAELFLPAQYERSLAEAGLAVDLLPLRSRWEQRVREVFEMATLSGGAGMLTGGKEGRHTEHLGYLLAEMQFLQRAYPGCEW